MNSIKINCNKSNNVNGTNNRHSFESTEQLLYTHYIHVVQFVGNYNLKIFRLKIIRNNIVQMLSKQNARNEFEQMHFTKAIRKCSKWWKCTFLLCSLKPSLMRFFSHENYRIMLFAVNCCTIGKSKAIELGSHQKTDNGTKMSVKIP